MYKDWNLKNVCFYTVHLTALVQLNSVKKHFPIFIRNLETKYTAIKINNFFKYANYTPLKDASYHHNMHPFKMYTESKM